MMAIKQIIKILVHPVQTGLHTLRPRCYGKATQPLVNQYGVVASEMKALEGGVRRHGRSWVLLALIGVLQLLVFSLQAALLPTTPVIAPHRAGQDTFQDGAALFKQAYDLDSQQNYRQAAVLLQQAAALGDPRAAYLLGNYYEEGSGGLTVHNDSAGYWYANAFTGLSVPSAQTDPIGWRYLGHCYYFGLGTTQDYAKAAAWYQKAAEAGHPNAKFNLANMYLEGLGVPQDYLKALRWYTEAAQSGDRDAQFNLGKMYYEGLGVAKDYARAFRWYSKSAQAGDMDAQFNLGVMYFIAAGVEQDYNKGVDWFKKSAAAGNPEAQYNLGYLYENGQILQKDLKMAVHWYRKAAENGDQEARQRLEQLKDQP